MAEEQNQTIYTTGHGYEAVEMEVKDRGLFDFMGKKKEEEDEEKKCEELLVTEMEKVSVEETKEEGKKVECEGEKEEDKHGFLEKLHRSHSSSSISSSDEEENGQGGEKRKKKKGLKKKIKEKLHGDNKEEDGEEKSAEAEVVVEASVVTVDDTSIKVERLDESVKLEETPVEEKKGFLEKIKEKLPGHGQHKKPAAEEAVASPECAVEHGKEHEGEGQKKGFLEKIKEKLPGYHKNGGEDSGPAGPTKSP